MEEHVFWLSVIVLVTGLVIIGGIYWFGRKIAPGRAGTWDYLLDLASKESLASRQQLVLDSHGLPSETERVLDQLRPDRALYLCRGHPVRATPNRYDLGRGGPSDSLRDVWLRHREGHKCGSDWTERGTGRTEVVP